MAILNFFEEKFRSYFHDYSVWIFGVEVTEHLQGSLSWSIVEKDGSNSASFILNNAQDKWTITDENLKGKFRQGNGEFGEDLKKSIFELKTDLQEEDPIVTGSKLYPLDPGRLIIHKMDPVRIFIHNPLTTLDEWMPVFTGFVENYDTTLDYINGDSIVNISCNDVRNAILQKARIAVNLPGQIIQSHANFAENIGESSKRIDRELAIADKKNIEDGIRSKNGEILRAGSATSKGAFKGIGPFNDVLFSNNSLNDALANKRFEEVFEEMILGTVRGLGNKNKDRGIGVISKGPSSIPGLGTNGSGLWPTYDRDQSLGEWYRLCLFGFKFGRFLTFDEVRRIGTNSIPEGEFHPIGSGVSLNILLPKQGTGAASLVESVEETGTPNSISWDYRLDRLLDLANRLDYQFYVNGFGDIIVEFPMYDFPPKTFGEFKTVLTVDSDMINDSITDEAQEVYNLVIATGGYAYQPENFAGDEANGTIPKAIALNGIMMKRYGVVSHNLSIPYLAKSRGKKGSITEEKIQDKLKLFATLELQKSWAKANNMTADFAYRPFLLPNKPMEFVYRNRRGTIYNSNNTMELFGECSTSVDIKYILNKDINGKFRFIGGQENMPISYSNLFIGEIKLEEEGIQSGSVGKQI